MTPPRNSVVPSCEDCGATVETTGGWGKPSGTAGSASIFTQTVQPANLVLGHLGYLCTPCWWARAGSVAA